MGQSCSSRAAGDRTPPRPPPPNRRRPRATTPPLSTNWSIWRVMGSRSSSLVCVHHPVRQRLPAREHGGAGWGSSWEKASTGAHQFRSDHQHAAGRLDEICIGDGYHEMTLVGDEDRQAAVDGARLNSSLRRRRRAFSSTVGVHPTRCSPSDRCRIRAPCPSPASRTSASSTARSAARPPCSSSISTVTGSLTRSSRPDGPSPAPDPARSEGFVYTSEPETLQLGQALGASFTSLAAAA